jgi:hypothetical protein
MRAPGWVRPQLRERKVGHVKRDPVLALAAENVHGALVDLEGHGRRGETGDQSEDDEQRLHWGSPLQGFAVFQLTAERAGGRIRNAFGGDGRRSGDQQAQDNKKLLHFKSPLE